MITTGALRRRGAATWTYGEAETVLPRPPRGDLPEEWRAKLPGRRFEPPALTVLRDAELAGPNLAGFHNQDLVLPVGYYGRIDLWERNYPYFEMACLARQAPATEIECAFSMAGVWSGNYFHWLLDHLPTLQAYYEYQKRTGETPLVLLASAPPLFVTESLNLLGIAYHIDDCHHYKVKRLIVPTWPRQDGYIRPGALDFLREKFAVGTFTGDKRIYITRKNAATRRVVNEEELYHQAAVVQMERLPFAQQLAVMSEAGEVIGPHGAGLANIVFANHPKTIELVTPAYTNPCCWLIAAAMGWEYGAVVCEPVKNEDMRVDTQKVEALLV